ncbi:hypothetical protein SAMN06265795_10267 [Noviherbaspirillum humi]|uniref:Transmembrane protein n=1 Tax=Noviherbaspirillum humi TaxID=1688639 RepID=A0A239DA10_9BURK|nr:hypothetical protein [Noviherbaspirillum humi]SNS28908.1 hypothetical protein SAMN06265795_10267 [Noviherbaspirillum humi]
MALCIGRIQRQGLAILFCLTLGCAKAAQPGFQIGIVNAQTEAALASAVERADDVSLAFLVVTRIKAVDDACSDELYLERRALLEKSRHPIALVSAGSDWSECQSDSGRGLAVERLTRLRELFHGDDFIPAIALNPVRQSATARFRSFAENMRWERDGLLFATLHLPAPNNNFRAEAGRNSEFEDRLVANQDWLHRLAAHARLKKAKAIVVFSDGNPLATPPKTAFKRDGYQEVRRQMETLAAGFSGKVLLVHAQAGSDESTGKIFWRGNLGALSVGPGWTRLKVTPGQPVPFMMESPPGPMKAGSHR